MEYNAKNYMAQGGDRLVIGGTLEIKEGALVTGLPAATASAATEETLGGVLAAEKSESDTVEAKIGEDHKLYVPPYTLPAAAADLIGGVKRTANQATSTAEDVATLVSNFNTLLSALKTAGIMAADA
jgi:hypothetical protein